MTLHTKSCVVDATAEALGIDAKELADELGHLGLISGFNPVELSEPLMRRGYAAIVFSGRYTKLETIAKPPYIAIYKEDGRVVSHAVANRLPGFTDWVLLFRRLADAVPAGSETPNGGSEQIATTDREPSV